MSKNEHEKVIEAVEDRFYEEKQLSNVGDIAEWMGISESRVRKLVEELTGTGLYKVYEGKGLPTLYMTEGMKNSIEAEAGEPDWIDEYGFERKRNIFEKIKEKQRKISEFRKLEGLLYLSGGPLEDSVEHALKELGFEPQKTEEDEDFVLKYDGKIFIIEVKGVSQKIRKRDIEELNSWLSKWIDKKKKGLELRGILIANHFRHKPPSERPEPLTEKAKEYFNYILKSSICIKSMDFFNLVKKLRKNEIQEEEARDKFLNASF